MDRFVRLRKIGEGSFGKALLVKSKKDGKQYVIKEINISKMSPKEREESRTEVRVLSRLKHPNIVTYMESFEENGNLYIVMEYCEGGDLYKKINSQRGILFPEDQVMNWFVQICLALKHVHDRKILHRDLKSQNIFLTKNGMIKLGDFGIARVLRNTVELARTCIGTPYYLSPEICENRPYNNKSDIWSLGCVLYELLTLKHAFEGGNIKNLILQIIRGSYTPVPLRYSAEVRSLVAQLFRRSPHDRPSVNSVLKKAFIQKRIQNFLSEEVMEEEFSHTVLHRKPFGVLVQNPAAFKPAKPVIKPPKISEPSAKYGVSVAKKKPARKPGSNEVGKKPAKPPSEKGGVKEFGEKKKELDARERRRKELAQNQEQIYQDYAKKVQQQRWEKQRRQQINRARERAWKNTQDIAISPEKAKNPLGANPAVKADVVQRKDPSVMQKYQARENGKENKVDRPESAKENRERQQVVAAERPVSAFVGNQKPPGGPAPAWEAARQGQENRILGGAAAERARVVEEFWMRKREAAANKQRGRAIYGGYDYKPPLENHFPVKNGIPARSNAPGNRKNAEEQDYLARLEAIRRQNYQERKQRMAGVRAPVEPSKVNNKENIPGDPRYDPDARRKKIAALKAQAEERAALLRKQLELRRKEVMQKIEDEGRRKVEEEQRREAAEFKRPSPVEHVKEEKPLKRAVPQVGLDTAMKQVGLGMTKIFRSNSESDVSNVKLKEAEIPHERKEWGNVPFELRMSMLPLEVTASAVEDTGAGDAVWKPSIGAGPARKQWGSPQKTQIVSALEKAKIVTATTTVPGGDEPDASKRVLAAAGTTLEENSRKVVVPTEEKPAIGVTITLLKESVEPPTDLGVTVTKSPTTTKTVVLKQDENAPSLSKQTTVSATSKVLKSPKADSEEQLPNPNQETLAEKLSDVKIGNEVDQGTLYKDETTKEAKEHPRSPIKAWTEDSINKVPKSPVKPAEVETAREAYQQFLISQRQLDLGEMEEEQQVLFQRVDRKEKENQSGEKEEHVDVSDISVEDLSFHTPDTSLTNATRTVGLQSGSYDTDRKRLRTCSLPDLRLLFLTACSPGTFFREQSIEDQMDGEGQEEDQENGDLEGTQEEEEEEALSNDDEEDEELEEIQSSEDEDNEEEFAHMLESMKDVLVSSARSPSPLKNVMTRSLEWDHVGEMDLPDDQSSIDNSESGRSSELSNLNEEWETDEDDDDNDQEDSFKKQQRQQKRQEDEESLFQRLEESRMKLERELGFDTFFKAYRYLQSIQENEDEDADVGSASEISEMLGDKEHLYPKILYLVMADTAYSEDNQ